MSVIIQSPLRRLATKPLMRFSAIADMIMLRRKQRYIAEEKASVEKAVIAGAKSSDEHYRDKFIFCYVVFPGLRDNALYNGCNVSYSEGNESMVIFGKYRRVDWQMEIAEDYSSDESVTTIQFSSNDDDPIVAKKIVETLLNACSISAVPDYVKVRSDETSGKFAITVPWNIAAYGKDEFVLYLYTVVETVLTKGLREAKRIAK